MEASQHHSSDVIQSYQMNKITTTILKCCPIALDFFHPFFACHIPSEYTKISSQCKSGWMIPLFFFFFRLLFGQKTVIFAAGRFVHFLW